MAFCRSQAPEVAYSGAYGAGKSRALCLKIVQRASIKGAREGLCRKHLVSLKATTLVSLLEPDGELPPVLPPGTYSHNKSDKVIRIKGGGEVRYFGLDDPRKIGSYNLSGVAIDEAVELNEADYQQLEGRVRLSAPDIVRQIYWAGNPGAPAHFLAARFGLALDAKPRPGCEAIQTNTFENTFLPGDYLARMRAKTGVDYQRNVEGRWVGSEGLVFDRWDRQVHHRDRDAGDFVRWYLAVDDGYSNPFVSLLVGEDGDGRLHVWDEVHQSNLGMSSKVAAAKRQIAMAEKLGGKVATAIIDPAAAALRDEFFKAGIHCASKVPKAVFDGIALVQEKLATVPDDGIPGLTVAPRCGAVPMEFESYEWAQRDGHWTDTPVKANDHAMDALRYLVAWLAQPQGGFHA